MTVEEPESLQANFGPQMDHNDRNWGIKSERAAVETGDQVPHSSVEAPPNSGTDPTLDPKTAVLQTTSPVSGSDTTTRILHCAWCANCLGILL